MDLMLRRSETPSDKPLLVLALSWVLSDGTEFKRLNGPDALLPACHAYFTDWGRPDDRAFIAESRSPKKTFMGASWVRRPLDGGVPFLGIGVSVEHRGRGVGTALLRACQRDAMDHGHDLSLSVHPQNRAVMLYRRCGFREVGLIKEPSTGPMIRMTWTLPAVGPTSSRGEPRLH